MKNMKLTDDNTRDFAKIYDYLRLESTLPDAADAIVVGGSGTRTDMADRAAELYKLGIAPYIIFSGFAHPNYGVNEAELLKTRAIELNVPESAIATESSATNTGLNIILSAKRLRTMGINAKRIILVHKPYMARRFLATAEVQWPDPRPEFFVTSVNCTFSGYLELEKARGSGDRFLSGLLKDYRAIKQHPVLGFASPQPVDRAVEVAYKRLLAAGFRPAVPDDSLSTDNFV